MLKHKTSEILWTDIKNDDSVTLFEHPVYDCLIDKNEYYKEFSKILDLLDGETMTDYIDIFFRRDAVFESALIFIGDNEKLDFYEWAVEVKCIPTLGEIHCGEDENIKNERFKLEDERKKNNERSQLIQQEKKLQKQNDASINDIKILQSIMENINKLANSENKKINKINKAINKFNNIYSSINKKNINSVELNKFELFLNDIRKYM